MAEIIGLPKLSPTMEEGVLIRWAKKEGDHIEPGELVAEVETDKANMDFNLEDDGYLLKILVEEGATVTLGGPVMILGEQNEDISDLLAQLASGNHASPAPTVETPTAPPAAVAPPPAKAAAAPPPPAPRPSPSAGGKLLASPLAKSLAIEHGIDLRQVLGSGPGGRIVERDIRALMNGGPAAAPTVTTQPSATAAAPATALVSTDVADPTASILHRDEPLSGVRKTIAKRMVDAKQSAPHFYLTRDIEVTQFFAFRKRVNELLAGRGKVSVNDLIVKAIALALRETPNCNAAFLGDKIRYFQEVHIGIAVAAEHGLITPVIRNADIKGLSIIASESKDLVSRARERKIKLPEIQGSTFTVSNLGMFGIREFTAIINPPEGAILAVGSTRDVPYLKDGRLAERKVMTVTLSCDHRVIDGAMGAVLLQKFAELVETPELLSL